MSTGSLYPKSDITVWVNRQLNMQKNWDNGGSWAQALVVKDLKEERVHPHQVCGWGTVQTLKGCISEESRFYRTGSQKLQLNQQGQT